MATECADLYIENQSPAIYKLRCPVCTDFYLLLTGSTIDDNFVAVHFRCYNCDAKPTLRFVAGKDWECVSWSGDLRTPAQRQDDHRAEETFRRRAGR
jgi:hypothetical protein